MHYFKSLVFFNFSNFSNLSNFSRLKFKKNKQEKYLNLLKIKLGLFTSNFTKTIENISVYDTHDGALFNFNYFIKYLQLCDH